VEKINIVIELTIQFEKPYRKNKRHTGKLKTTYAAFETPFKKRKSGDYCGVLGF
jgi:hypothetical protein